MAPKRSPSPSSPSSPPPAKAIKKNIKETKISPSTGRPQQIDAALSHPSTGRGKEIDADTPYSHLQAALAAQPQGKEPSRILHWFRGKDLRIQDNKGLHAASQLAQSAKVPLVCLYVWCPAEESYHGTSPARVDFMLQGVRIMQRELKELNIPLVVLVADSREAYVDVVVDWVKKNGISQVYANFEVEVDELRRDEKFVKEMSEGGVRVELHHDQTVVEPGTMLTASGTPMKVFTPYHKAWLQKIKDEPGLLDTVPPPAPNSDTERKGELKDFFDSPIPDPPKDKSFKTKEECDRIRSLWPPGHAAAEKRMKSFLQQISRYASTRSNPAANSTSRLSAYFSAGMFSVREALTHLCTTNKNSPDFSPSGSSNSGIHSWVREIVFRELYRQTTLTTPHTSMNLPQNLKFEFVQWENDEEGWRRWCEGTTGEPFIDAGMRQLNTEAYMHNRLRMNVSSYLTNNLLIDYRRGERYFAETLIDWDMNNNTQGWEPSYTVFNPVSQAEKNDPEGEYIRKWVPELRGVEGKAVFAPSERLSKGEFENLGYPRPYVDWRETKERARERFKRDMQDAEL